jgi:hypothetical protein
VAEKLVRDARGGHKIHPPEHEKVQGVQGDEYSSEEYKSFHVTIMPYPATGSTVACGGKPVPLLELL